MPADIFVYAIVAAGLLFWLKSLLGTHHGDEKERHNPFAAAADMGAREKDPAGLASPREELSPEDKIRQLAANPVNNMALDNKTAENGLLEISHADKNFDVTAFLGGAQDAFTMIVEAFARGEKDILKNLLSEDVYNAFEAAIQAREDRKETLQKEIHAIRKAAILEARLEGKTAFITVRFVADERSVTKSSEGEIIDGNPDKTTEMVDVWSFLRSVKSKDPKWLVYETRSDHADDNESIPNTQ